MKTNLTSWSTHESWNTHDWISRPLKLVPNEPLIQQGCRECDRAFVDECLTGDRYAVHVSVFKFHRLSDEVTSRWLSEKCPAQRTLADEADRQTRFIGGPLCSVGEMANDSLDLASSPTRKSS